MRVRYVRKAKWFNNYHLTIGNIYEATINSFDNYELIDNIGGITTCFEYEIEVIEETQTDQIVESIINQFKQRSEVGIAKYGTTLERKDLTTLEWIEHAKQEAMDFILYLERLKQEML
jgi:hypothetical protein